MLTSQRAQEGQSDHVYLCSLSHSMPLSPALRGMGVCSLEGWVTSEVTSSGTEGSTCTPVRKTAHPAKPESHTTELNYPFWEKRQGQKAGMRLEQEKGGKRLEACSAAAPLQPERRAQGLRAGRGEGAEDRHFSVHPPRTRATANVFILSTAAAAKGLPCCPRDPEPSPRTL